MNSIHILADNKPTPVENPQCHQQSLTRVGDQVPCSGALIFEDNFDFFDGDKWRVEQRFSKNPVSAPYYKIKMTIATITRNIINYIHFNQDNEFAVFMRRSDTVAVLNGGLMIAPVRLGDDVPVNEINFGLK